MTALPPSSPLEQPPAPPGRDRSLLVAAVAVVVAAALVAGIAVLVTRDDGDGAASPSTTEARAEEGDGSTTTAAPDELEAAVAELSAFVAEERGRPFRSPVEVELLDDDDFVARLRALSEEEEDSVEESAGLLRALGLLDADEDLVAELDEALSGGVLGFYDPEDDELVVRGSDLSVGVRSTLVHELTHAWDDQHFELDRPDLEQADDESSFGFSALVEGNAERVEAAWGDTLTQEERVQLRADRSSASERAASADVPPIVGQLLTLPYAAGGTLVAALAQAGGEERIDAAFAAPPTTSEQTLDPTTYVEGPEPALEVPEPAADGPVADRGVFGAAGVLVTLVDRLPVDQARTAAGGWGGDRYVTWEAGDRTCMRVAFAGDTPTDLSELREAWTDWAEAGEGADVREADGRVVVTSCG